MRQVSIARSGLVVPFQRTRGEREARCPWHFGNKRTTPKGRQNSDTTVATRAYPWDFRNNETGPKARQKRMIADVKQTRTFWRAGVLQTWLNRLGPLLGLLLVILVF